jgi:hypothetical protein
VRQLLIVAASFLRGFKTRVCDEKANSEIHLPKDANREKSAVGSS